MRSRFTMLTFVLFFCGCVITMKPQAIKLPARQNQSDGISITADSFSRSYWVMEYFIETHVIVENNGQKPFVLAPVDVMLVDARGQKTVAVDAWSEFWLNSATLIPEMPDNPAVTQQYGAMAKYQERYNPDFKKHAEARLEKEEVLLPGEKKEFYVFFPETIDHRNIRALSIRDPISGKTHQVSF